MEPIKTTRRGFLISAGAVMGLSVRVSAAISYTIEETYSILDGETKGPTEYSYDMVEWGGWGVLEFEDWEYFEFGNENYPVETTTTEPTEPTETTEEPAEPVLSPGGQADLPFGITLPSSLSFVDGASLPMSGDRILPMQIKIRRMEPGTSILLMGVMAVLLAAATLLKNYAAGVMWAIAFVLLIVSGLFGMQLQLFWISVIFVGVLLAIGIAIRWAK